MAAVHSYFIGPFSLGWSFFLKAVSYIIDLMRTMFFVTIIFVVVPFTATLIFQPTYTHLTMISTTLDENSEQRRLNRLSGYGLLDDTTDPVLSEYAKMADHLAGTRWRRSTW